jgi:nitrogen fixation protein FixH
MSWGTRIAILYGAFVAMIVFMVFRTMKENVDLVSPDYYQQELKFQEQIDRQNQSATLEQQPTVEVSATYVTVRFPAAIAAEDHSGTIRFYRPSDSSKDFATPLQLDSSGVQMVASDKFIKGFYEAQLTWSAGGKNYYNEFSLYIP